MTSPRDRIIAKSLELFHKQGYNSTGVNQIICEANVAKATFYQHFKSKDDLCAEYLKHRHDYWFDNFKNFTSKRKEPKEKVLEAFEFIKFMNVQENFRGCSFLNILSEISGEKMEILKIIQQHKEHLRIFFKSQIRDEISSTHIYLLFESALIESQVFKSNELVEKAKKIIHTLI